MVILAMLSKILFRCLEHIRVFIYICILKFNVIKLVLYFSDWDKSGLIMPLTLFIAKRKDMCTFYNLVVMTLRFVCITVSELLSRVIVSSYFLELLSVRVKSTLSYDFICISSVVFKSAAWIIVSLLFEYLSFIYLALPINSLVIVSHAL